MGLIQELLPVLIPVLFVTFLSVGHHFGQCGNKQVKGQQTIYRGKPEQKMEERRPNAGN